MQKRTRNLMDRTVLLGLLLSGMVFSAVAQAQGADPTDPCSEETVVEWRKAADRAAKESAANAQETIDNDPEGPGGRIESVDQQIKEKTDTCLGTTGEDLKEAGGAIIKAMEEGVVNLGDALSKITLDKIKDKLANIDVVDLACKGVRGAGKLGVGALKAIASLPPGIEKDVRFAIWRNQRMAESRANWVVRYAGWAPRRWTESQVQGFVYHTRRDLESGYPHRPWPDDWF